MIKLFWILTVLPRKIINRFLNILASFLYQKKIRIDWRCLKIINPNNIFLGSNFSSGQGLWLEPIHQDSRIMFGDYVNISDWTHITALKSVTISSGCLIGSNVLISDHSHGCTKNLESCFRTRPNSRELISRGPIYIEENVWIGDGVVILGNVRIGRGSIVAASSVVNCDVPPFSIVAGIPAKVIRMG